MLVLKRREGEALLVRLNDTEFWVSLEEIKGNQAAIGIEAPSEVEVIREELLDLDETAEQTST